MDEPTGQPGAVPERPAGMGAPTASEVGETAREGARGAAQQEPVGVGGQTDRGYVQRERAVRAESPADSGGPAALRLADDEVTGIANKVTASERAKRGLAEADEPDAPKGIANPEEYAALAALALAIWAS